jgi:hypothetical protein
MDRGWLTLDRCLWDFVLKLCFVLVSKLNQKHSVVRNHTHANTHVSSLLGSQVVFMDWRTSPLFGFNLRFQRLKDWEKLLWMRLVLCSAKLNNNDCAKHYYYYHRWFLFPRWIRCSLAHKREQAHTQILVNYRHFKAAFSSLVDGQLSATHCSKRFLLSFTNVSTTKLNVRVNSRVISQRVATHMS